MVNPILGRVLIYHIDLLVILQALLKYGYANFSLEILEYCEVANVLSREQYWMDTLNPEYNILSTAGSSLGCKRSEETKAKIYAKLSGSLHPMYGTISPNAKATYIYTLDGVLVNSFSSQAAAAEELGINVRTVRLYIQTAKLGRWGQQAYQPREFILTGWFGTLKEK
ncbi:hypothetical protein BC938DRAFT_483387 [Jimgerdemannia flammicorona]|uniref:Nuclease-associated modular DNA-binding 1 domain-containing protein n=1 Tax=Jimgerdemannia flammicorona TaxID=994334 RepID=A0A433QC57_9FUNG|nr:hypothetical protein BC938DRAFT_483387 [Jimgerdemannia flammicorona]